MRARRRTVGRIGSCRKVYHARARGKSGFASAGGNRTQFPPAKFANSAKFVARRKDAGAQTARPPRAHFNAEAQRRRGC